RTSRHVPIYSGYASGVESELCPVRSASQPIWRKNSGLDETVSTSLQRAAMLQDRLNDSDNHDFFIRWHDPNGDTTLISGNHVASAGVPRGIQLQTQKIEPFTNARSHFWSVFSNAA